MVITGPFWEQAYQDLSGATFGNPSREFHELLAQLPPKAEVLDLGCGEGRNALFLAGHGCRVTAVDISTHGIAKLNHLARDKGLSVCAKVQDMREYAFDEDFDLIISHGCLHLIERSQWQRLLTEFKTHTRAGGYNAVTVFTDALPPPEDLKALCLGLFHEGELYDCYAGWTTFHQESYVLRDQHPHSTPHEHPINKLVARKPL